MGRVARAIVLLVSLAVPGAPWAADTGLALLQSVSEAYRTESFRGRFIYVRGNRIDAMQVVRARLDGVEYERLSHLDDTAAEVFRRGEEVVCVHPDARITRLDSTGQAGPFRQFAAISAAIGAHYTVSAPEAARVAGRSADLVRVQPRDPHRLGYRFWIDRETKLLLRYEVLGRRGKVLEAVGFVELETGVTVPRELFDPPAGSDVVATRIRATGEGVPVPVTPSWLPPGFARQAVETQQSTGKGTAVTALRYSDGLSSVTLFIEPAGDDARPVSRQVGPTVIVGGVLDSGGPGRFLVTLVGEVPPQTAVKIVGSTRHDRRGPPAGRAVPGEQRPWPFPPPGDDSESDAP